MEVLVLIFRVFEALVEGMLALRPMDVAGRSLENLVLSLGGRLVVPAVVALEVATLVPVVAPVRATLVEDSTMRVAPLLVTLLASIALIREVANLVVVALRHVMAEFALGAKLDLFLSLLGERAVGHLRIVDRVEVLADGRECLVTETSSALEVPVAVLLVERHIKPLDLECVVWPRHVAGRESFSRAKHLLKSAEMIEWLRHHRLLKGVVPSRLKVNVLPIPRLFLIQRPLKKERERSTIVLFRVAILLARNWPRRVDGLREMLMEHLLPSSPVLALQHIFELRKGVDPGELTLFCPLIEFGDRSIDCELNRIASVVLVDLNETFVLWIVAPQLVDLG